MRKWIVFRAEKGQPGWKERKYAHTESLTKTIAEHFDCSDKPLPEPGYRPPEFLRVEDAVDENFPAAKTHYRLSNWEVTRTETYTPDIPEGMGFDLIAICYCKFSPIDAELQPLPERQISVTSFDGNQEAYQN